jgi:hypothetical protein
VGDLVCAECGRKPRDDENAADDWRACSDGACELHVFCPEYAEREFGKASSARLAPVLDSSVAGSCDQTGVG